MGAFSGPSMTQFGCGLTLPPSSIDKMKSLFFEDVEGIVGLEFELCSPNFHHIKGGPMHTVGTCGECAHVCMCALCVQFLRGMQQCVLHIWSVQELPSLPMPTKSAFSTFFLLKDVQQRNEYST